MKQNSKKQEMETSEAIKIVETELGGEVILQAGAEEEMEFLCIFLADLFFGRTDIFSQQDKTGKWFTQRRILTQRDLRNHLSGKATLGGYSLAPGGYARTLCFDLDISKEVFRKEGLSKRLRRELEDVCRIVYQGCLDLELAPLVEFSGRKGWHLWCPFLERVPACDVRDLGKLILERGGFKKHKAEFHFEVYPDLHVEVFPKQSTIGGDGLGNLVKCPLGKHQVTGKRSYFVDPNTFEKIADPHQLLAGVY